MIVLGWYAAFGREKRASVLHAAPLNPYPQPVQVLGAYTYKIPVVPVFTGGKWKPTRIEYGDNWYLVGIRAEDLNGLRVRI
jgi:hypothetical protein